MLDSQEAVSPKSQAWSHYQRGDFQKSLEVFNANLKDFSSDPWYLHDRARALCAVGGTANFKESVKQLEDLHRKLPTDAQIAVSLAQALGRAGQYRRCADMYRIATTLDPKNHEVSLVGDLTGEPPVVARRLHDTGLSFFQKGNFREALRYYDLAVAIGGERAAVWSLHDKGVALMRLGDYEEAAKVLEKCQNLLPDSAIITLDLANVYESFAKNIHSQGKPVNYPAHDIAATYCQEVLLKDPQNIIARELMLKIDGVDIDRNIKVPINKKVIDGKTVWVDEKGNSLVRNFVREREIIRSYLSDLKQTDPEYYAYLESLSSVPTMHPMDDNCRVSVNIPAWMEGRNIYNVLMMYIKQSDRSGNALDPSLFEININLNRKSGSEMDNSVQEIERFIIDTGGKYKINYINIENDPPFNRIGHARRLMTDLNLLRSIQRNGQKACLYIESEDADLEAIDPNTVIGIIEKMDGNPHLDSIRGIQDFWPVKLQENDYLFLQKRLWNFVEVLMRRQKYRSEVNRRWNRKWNRVITGGWNTAYSAEAYALIHGYSNMITGSDMNIGEKITDMRANNSQPNLGVIGISGIKSSSSPRRFIEAIRSQHPPYADSFADDSVNMAIRSTTIDEQLDSIKHLARITDANSELFNSMLGNFMDFYREVTPNEMEARKLMNGVLLWLGFQKDDFVITPKGEMKVNNWENIRKVLANYREKHNKRQYDNAESATPVVVALES